VNLPTEEVFTAPDPRRAEGTISCTRPLMLGGVLVEGLQLTLAGGRIVDVRARAGQTAVESQLTVDAGARRLGEVALVDASSTVAQTGVTYWQTLLDENATCHLAWGAGIPNAIVGWEGMSAQQLGEAGVNQSTVHTDVMVGGPEVTVTGHRRESSELTILTNETWQLTDEQVADAR
jgi:aminopeptidase